MTSINQIVYDARADVKFHFVLSKFRQHPQKEETFDILPSKEFLGLVLNLGEPVDYCGSGLLSATMPQAHYNFVYLPPTSYSVTIPCGPHHSLVMRLEQATLNRSALDFPFLKPFMEKVMLKEATFLREQHLPIPMRMQEEIDALLYNTSRDESMGNLFREVKSFEIYFGALTDMADLLLGLKPAYVVNDPVITKATDYLKKHIREAITIEILSIKIGINKRKLQEGFKIHTGKAVHEYVIQLRMEAAKKLLRDPFRSVKSIAIAVGYTETGFSSAYKKYYNQQPTAVRSMDTDKDEC